MHPTDVRDILGDEAFAFLGALMAPAAQMGESSDEVALIREIAPPQHEVGLHSHPDPECFYVLQGELEVFLADAEPGWRRIGAGGSCLAAGGVSHALRNPADAPVDFIIATTNRLLGFFQRGGRRNSDGQFAQPSDEDEARVARLAEEYGYWRAPPDESFARTGVR